MDHPNVKRAAHRCTRPLVCQSVRRDQSIRLAAKLVQARLWRRHKASRVVFEEQGFSNTGSSQSLPALGTRMTFLALPSIPARATGDRACGGSSCAAGFTMSFDPITIATSVDLKSIRCLVHLHHDCHRDLGLGQQALFIV